MAPVAAKLGTDAATAAEHCVTVATATMMGRALPFLARLGDDPQHLTLVLFGGAGSIQGPLLAAEMGIREVVIPPTPSVFCAAGCLVAEVVHDAVRSLHTRSRDLAGEFGQLAAEVGQWLDGQIDPAWLLDRRVERYAAMRYAGQSFQLDVALGENDGVAEAAAAFHREHLRLYAHADEANPVEFIELRARIIGALPAPTNIPARTIQRERVARPYTTRPIRLDGALHPSVPIYRREELGEGSRVAGPAIIEQSDTTIMVPAQFVAQTGVAGELRLVRTH